MCLLLSKDVRKKKRCQIKCCILSVDANSGNSSVLFFHCSQHELSHFNPIILLHLFFLSLCLSISLTAYFFFTLRMERSPAIHSANYKNPLLFLFLSYIYLFCVFFPTLPLREQQPITMQEVSPYAGYQSKRGRAIATTEQPSK